MTAAEIMAPIRIPPETVKARLAAIVLTTSNVCAIDADAAMTPHLRILNACKLLARSLPPVLT